MGRRSINTTKSGKYMNPTDQARKEARKRELKKNKKQRMMVRMAVLKGKDPRKLLDEMEIIDEMEYDPSEAPRLNERVLKEKRKKLKETFDRVIRMYEKEDPEMSIELRKLEVEYEKKRMKMQQYYEQVKNAERVRLEQIPLPEAPSMQAIPSMIPLPGDIPLPMAPLQQPVHGILKKYSALPKSQQLLQMRKRKPPGPPPGPPAYLSDSDDDDDGQGSGDEYDPARDIQENLGHVGEDDDSDRSSEEDYGDVAPPGESNDLDPPPAKQRKIRFEDDATRDPDEVEKDTRLRYRAGVARQPTKKSATKQSKRSRKDDDDDVSTDDDDRSLSSDDSDDSEDIDGVELPGMDTSNISLPPGPPPGIPPGMPPGGPRLPPLRGALPGPPRMMPPGPPRGRPPGMPPPMMGPNMGMPPRMPPGPPGMPPPRMIRPPLNVPPPNMMGSQGVIPMPSNPNVLTAPPTIVKPPRKADEDRRGAGGATIEAKPQIKNLIVDVTRFMPTALKVRREMKDAKGRIVKPSGKVEEQPQTKTKQPAMEVQMKDDAYDTFMKEMKGLL